MAIPNGFVYFLSKLLFLLSATNRTDGLCSLLVNRNGANYIEHDREYHGWRKGLYMYPCDEVSFFEMPLAEKEGENIKSNNASWNNRRRWKDST